MYLKREKFKRTMAERKTIDCHALSRAYYCRHDTRVPYLVHPNRERKRYLEELVEAKGAMLMTLAKEPLLRFQFNAKH